MESFVSKKPHHELGWDVFDDFRNERRLINQEHYEQVLMSFQKSLSPTFVEKSMITHKRMFRAVMVKTLVIDLLGKLNTEIFRNEKSTIFSKAKKGWANWSETYPP